MLNASVVNDHHQAFINNKCICIRYWTACRSGYIAISLVMYKFFT
jgi:hypothetical protein